MLSPTAAALSIAVMLVHPSHLTGHTSNALARQSSPVEKSVVLARNGTSTTNFPIMQENPSAVPSHTTLNGGIMQVNPFAGPSSSGVGNGIMKLDPPSGSATPSLKTYPIMKDPSPPIPGTPALKDPQN